MKRKHLSVLGLAFGLALFAPATLMAQKDDKGEKDKKEMKQIVITAKGDNNEKTVIEINGDKITVNGKPLDEYKDKNGDINVRVNKIKQLDALARIPGMGAQSWSFGGDGNDMLLYSGDENRAMLGVTTEKTENGAEVQEITKESAAEKAGLKENDIITKIDDSKIEGPDDLSAAIKKHKPGDKVSVTYLRDKKEQKTTAELTKWKGVSSFAFGPSQGFDMDFEKMMPKMPAMPRMPATPRYKEFNGQGWSWSGNGPKLGISVQDTDDGKGVKVIGVDDESNADKAGIKEDDVITEVDGKAVNGADEIAKVIKESKDKMSVMMKLQRGGKTQNIEVRMPRKVKTADL